MTTKLSKASFFGASIGTMIEHYDYTLFVIFLPIIAPIFFPSDSAYDSLIKGYFVLLLAMIARPFGGVVFGYLGDMFGRKRALLMSMYGIACATVIIGLTPSYQTLGVLAVVIVTLAKSVQMFCFGGEYNGAGIYVVEHARNKNEGFIGGSLTAMTLCGSLMASLMGVVVTLGFMPAWSWRIAFLLGGVVGVFGILYRKKLLETPGFVHADSKQHKLRNIFKHYRAEFITGVLLGGFATLPFATVLAFINPILMANHVITSHQLMLLQAMLMLVAIAVLLISGRLSDKYTPAKIMKIGSLLLVFLAFPLLRVVDTGMIGLIIAVEVALIIINEILLGPSNAYLKSLFPMQYRYRATSLSFCLGMSIVGGLTPLIEIYIYKSTHLFSVTAVWPIAIGLLTFIGLSLVGKKTSRFSAAQAA